ncbi:MAG: hypothetical protein ABR956_18370, partial [Terracidiphilus sp.]
EKVDREPEANYWIGKAYQAAGEPGLAKQYWQKSADAAAPKPTGQQNPDSIGPRTIQRCYQAFSLRELGRKDEASAQFRDLLERANTAIRQEPAQFNLDASVAEVLLQRSNLAGAHYIAALSYLGLDDKKKAAQELRLALDARSGLASARFTLAQLQ